MMPPKMLTSTALTRGSARRMRNASVTWSLLAPPPTSRKLAGSPPWYLMMSIVLMARPAPLTRQPMLPVRLMKLRPALAARSSAGFSSRLVAQLLDVGMAEQGVVVEGHLGVEGQHLARRRDDQRIDLGQAAILVEEHLRQRRHDLLGLRHLLAGEAQLEGQPRGPGTAAGRRRDRRAS